MGKEKLETLTEEILDDYIKNGDSCDTEAEYRLIKYLIKTNKLINKPVETTNEQSVKCKLLNGCKEPDCKKQCQG
jgi:hypothetical protein